MSQIHDYASQGGQSQIQANVFVRTTPLNKIPPARPEDLTYQRFDGEPPKMKAIHVCLAEPERTLVVVTQVEDEVFDSWSRKAFDVGVDVIAPNGARFRYPGERVIGIGDTNSIPAASVANAQIIRLQGYSWHPTDEI